MFAFKWFGDREEKNFSVTWHFGINPYTCTTRWYYILRHLREKYRMSWWWKINGVNANVNNITLRTNMVRARNVTIDVNKIELVINFVKSVKSGIHATGHLISTASINEKRNISKHFVMFTDSAKSASASDVPVGVILSGGMISLINRFYAREMNQIF